MRHSIKWAAALALAAFTFNASAADGKTVTYQVNGADYEGYFVSPAADAPGTHSV